MSDIAKILKDKNWVLYASDDRLAYFKNKKNGADIYVGYPKWLLTLLDRERKRVRTKLQGEIKCVLGVDGLNRLDEE